MSQREVREAFIFSIVINTFTIFGEILALQIVKHVKIACEPTDKLRSKLFIELIDTDLVDAVVEFLCEHENLKSDLVRNAVVSSCMVSFDRMSMTTDQETPSRIFAKTLIDSLQRKFPAEDGNDEIPSFSTN